MLWVISLACHRGLPGVLCVTFAADFPYTNPTLATLAEELLPLFILWRDRRTASDGRTSSSWSSDNLWTKRIPYRNPFATGRSAGRRFASWESSQCANPFGNCKIGFDRYSEIASLLSKDHPADEVLFYRCVGGFETPILCHLKRIRFWPNITGIFAETASARIALIPSIREDIDGMWWFRPLMELLRNSVISLFTLNQSLLTNGFWILAFDGALELWRALWEFTDPEKVEVRTFRARESGHHWNKSSGETELAILSDEAWQSGWSMWFTDSTKGTVKKSDDRATPETAGLSTDEGIVIRQSAIQN